MLEMQLRGFEMKSEEIAQWSGKDEFRGINNYSGDHGSIPEILIEIAFQLARMNENLEKRK